MLYDAGMKTQPIRTWLVAAAAATSACGPTPQSATVDRAAPSSTLTSVARSSTAPPATLSCAAEIGAESAAKRVAICRDVSPATHPPCNAANSCAMIEGEIARSCALFEDTGCTPAPKSPAAAAELVRRYYSAINARDYATAWTSWGDDGRPGQTYTAFVRGFAHTRSTRATIDSLEPGDAGAGSIYQPVPVTVDATLDDGTRQRFVGSYFVRRVNDVDGATPGQLRWHLGSAEMRRVPIG